MGTTQRDKAGCGGGSGERRPSLFGLGLARTYVAMVFMLAWNSFSYQGLVVSAQGHLVAMFLAIAARFWRGSSSA